MKKLVAFLMAFVLLVGLSGFVYAKDNSSGNESNSSNGGSGSGKDDNRSRYDDKFENKTKDDDKFENKTEDDDKFENKTEDDDDHDERKTKMEFEEENGKTKFEYEMERGGVKVKVKVEIRTRKDGTVERKVKYEYEGEDSNGTEIKTNLKLKDRLNSTEGEAFLSAVLSTGEEYGIKIFPNKVKELALERLKAADGVVKLEEKVHEDKLKAVYKVETNKHGRFFGVFKMKMKVSAEVDPETGEFLGIDKPWWAFLVSGEENYDSDNELEDLDDDSAFCTEDAKICSDGSSVSRNPELNCEFDPCP